MNSKTRSLAKDEIALALTDSQVIELQAPLIQVSLQ